MTARVSQVSRVTYTATPKKNNVKPLNSVFLTR